MITRQQLQVNLSSQSGFTIIESLVALILVAVLLAAISPVIVIATATRLQAKRVNIATQAARSYIDGVRSGAIPAPPKAINGIATSLSSYPAPTGGIDPANTSICQPRQYCFAPNDDLYCYGEGDSSCGLTSYKDMMVQAFRFNPGSTDPKQGYTLGVRVYRTDALKEANPPLLTIADTKVKQATFTGGTGFRKAPLVEITTEITPSSATFDNLCNRLKDQTNPNNPNRKSC